MKIKLLRKVVIKPAHVTPDPAAEEWRVVPYYPEYEVSSQGRVKRVIASQGTTQGLLTPDKRHAVTLYRKHVTGAGLDIWQIKIVELVLLAFVGPKPPSPVRPVHLDGNEYNCALTNVAWSDTIPKDVTRFTVGPPRHSRSRVFAMEVKIEGFRRILTVLPKNDEEPITQTELIGRFESGYGVVLSHATVKRALSELVDLGKVIFQSIKAKGESGRPKHYYRLSRLPEAMMHDFDSYMAGVCDYLDPETYLAETIDITAMRKADR